LIVFPLFVIIWWRGIHDDRLEGATLLRFMLYAFDNVIRAIGHSDLCKKVTIAYI
jgi:hypothetical protein